MIDGEGCIAACWYKTTADQRERAGLQLVISNCSLVLLEECMRVARGGTITVKRKPVNPRHQQQYVWRLHKVGEIRRLLDDIRPYLIAKGQQADLARELCDLQFRAKYTKGASARITDEEQEQRRKLVAEIQALHHRQEGT